MAEDEPSELGDHWLRVLSLAFLDHVAWRERGWLTAHQLLGHALAIWRQVGDQIAAWVGASQLLTALLRRPP